MRGRKPRRSPGLIDLSLVRYSPQLLSFSSITATDAHTCGLAAAIAYCWGSFDTLPGNSSPCQVAGGLTFVSITSGYAHVCGLTAAAALYCWGNNYYNPIGDGTGTRSLTPIAVTAGAGFTAIQSGNYSSCALAGGVVICWPARAVVPTPAPIVQLARGASCGLDAAGNALCWWQSQNSNQPSWTVVPVAGGVHFASLASSGAICGIDLTGAAWCWGDNTYGEIGSPDAAGPPLFHFLMRCQQRLQDRRLAPRTAVRLDGVDNGIAGRTGHGRLNGVRGPGFRSRQCGKPPGGPGDSGGVRHGDSGAEAAENSTIVPVHRYSRRRMAAGGHEDGKHDRGVLRLMRKQSARARGHLHPQLRR